MMAMALCIAWMKRGEGKERGCPDPMRIQILHAALPFACTEGGQGDRLTISSVDSILSLLKGGSQALEKHAVINAFQVPKISYDAVGRKLYADDKPRSIFAPAAVSAW
jgi:hypothetical protein